MLLGLMMVAALGLKAQEPAAAGGAAVGVDRLVFQYGLAHPALPALGELDHVQVRLVRTDGVWHPAEKADGELVALGSIPAGSQFDAGALREVAQAILHWYNARHLFGVWVAFSDLESSSTGVVDNRPAGERTAKVVIWASQIAEVRTLARGLRFKPEKSINNPKHRRILTGSPLHPGAGPQEPGSLFRQDILEEYLRALSLHPGRRVEASIASAGEPGKVVLDYLVNETKPWQLFSQITNAGTEATGTWRGRIGFQHNQLTNHDDILNLDAISTPDFHTYGTFLSYRIPIMRPATLLFRVYGSYGDFLANDSTLLNLRFAGKNWLGGAELTNRLPLWREWELVSALGANYNHYDIRSEISGTALVRGNSNFLVPFLSATLRRDNDWASFAGMLRVESTVGSFANTDSTNGIPALGRIGADANWTSLRWSVNESIFLDPLFNRGSTERRLVNELSLRARGRYLLRGKRLIPQEEEPMGGAFTVRGYPESILSADEFVLATAEYGYHLARNLKAGEPGTLFGRPFRWRPQAQQRPDWDLILRAFVDYGYRSVSPVPLAAGQTPTTTPSLIERKVSMAGAGGGVEVVVLQNLSVRCDVGTALMELRDDTRQAGQQVVVPQGDVHAYLVASFSW